MLKIKKSKTDNHKHGFTLVELLVTLTLLSLVLVLTYQLSTSFYRQYRAVEMRWMVQTATQRVMEYFKGHGEPLNNSSRIDIFYKEDLNPVEYSEDNSTGNIMEGIPSKKNTAFAYIFSKKDENDNNILYVLDRGKPWEELTAIEKAPYIDKAQETGQTAEEVYQQPLELTKYAMGWDDEGFESIPIRITFNISVAPVQALPTGDGGVKYTGGRDKYLDSTVDVNVSAGSEEGGSYSLTTSFSLGNMQKEQRINFDGSDPTLTSNDCSVAGWTSKTIPCPVDTAVYPNATKEANILRFISAQAFLDGTVNNGQNISIENACFSRASMQGSAVEMQVVNALRDFRDNVLTKSSLGNKIIDTYYNTVSPALLSFAQEHPFALKIGKAVLIPVSMLTFFISE